MTNAKSYQQEKDIKVCAS